MKLLGPLLLIIIYCQTATSNSSSKKVFFPNAFNEMQHVANLLNGKTKFSVKQVSKNLPRKDLIFFSQLVKRPYLKPGQKAFALNHGLVIVEKKKIVHASYIRSLSPLILENHNNKKTIFNKRSLLDAIRSTKTTQSNSRNFWNVAATHILPRAFAQPQALDQKVAFLIGLFEKEYWADGNKKSLKISALNALFKEFDLRTHATCSSFTSAEGASIRMNRGKQRLELQNQIVSFNGPSLLCTEIGNSSPILRPFLSNWKYSECVSSTGDSVSDTYKIEQLQNQLSKNQDRIKSARQTYGNNFIIENGLEKAVSSINVLNNNLCNANYKEGYEPSQNKKDEISKMAQQYCKKNAFYNSHPESANYRNFLTLQDSLAIQKQIQNLESEKNNNKEFAESIKQHKNIIKEISMLVQKCCNDKHCAIEANQAGLLKDATLESDVAN